VRIAFQHAAVHEGARVAFVGVAQHVLLVSRRFAREFPLEPGQEARTSAAAQAGLLYGVRHLLGRHFGQHLGQCLISVAGDVFFDICRVDDAAVAQYDFLLLLKEINFLQRGNNLRRGGHLEIQPAYRASLEQVLGYDFIGILRLQSLVKHPVGVNDGDRTNGAWSQTSRAYQFYFLVQFVLAQGFFKRRNDGMGPGGHTSRAGANQHMRMDGVHNSIILLLVLFALRPG